ncbi:MAG: hypothetical protein E7513_05005 [Ruminococcaceae bacterium]|nr:hypothetical protein [Oscillospiraceae bacterium]
MKKTVSLILAIMMLLSVFSINSSAVEKDLSALEYEANNDRCISLKDAIKAYEEENDVKIETYRNYFYIPDGSESFFADKGYDVPTWYNEYSKDICIWYSDTMAENAPVPESYCGYSIEKYGYSNLYYADIPVGVTQFMINNGVEQLSDRPIYSSCCSSILGLEDANPDGTFPNHDNEIFVFNEFDHASMSMTGYFYGEWYYFKGMGCYSNAKKGSCVNPAHDHKSVKKAVKEYEDESGETLDTNRYYFLMPDGTNGQQSNYDDNAGNFADSWYNEYSSKPAIYWYGYEEGFCPDSMPGYTLETGDSPSVFYADVPTYVSSVYFNNNLNFGWNIDKALRDYMFMTFNINTQYYDAGESENYPDGTDSFDEMIFVISPDTIIVDWPLTPMYRGGEWYYYYGNGCYGTVKNGDDHDCIRDDHKHDFRTLEEVMADYEAQTGEKLSTNRYYFLMPDGTNGIFCDEEDWIYPNQYYPSWYNDKSDSAGIYWWDSGVLDPNSWPGYKINEADSKCVYYADVPKAVETMIFNNHVDGGMDPTQPIYNKSRQTGNIYTGGYDVGESDTYPSGLSTFDNMIYVIDPSLYPYADLENISKVGYGEWYYYYGDGCYGTVENGTEHDCIRDDHEHETFEDKFVEYCGNPKEGNYSYSGPLYYHYKEDLSEPEWFLATGSSGFSPTDMLYGIFGDYCLYGCSTSPSKFFMHIYMFDENKFYSIEEAWEKGFIDKEEVFTEYLGPNKKARLIGDADENGKLTITDATFIQRALAELTVLDDWIAASHAFGEKLECLNDVDRDGKRTVMDATTIQRKLAGLE